jgi:hypothetical protein
MCGIDSAKHLKKGTKDEMSSQLMTNFKESAGIAVAFKPLPILFPFPLLGMLISYND